MGVGGRGQVWGRGSTVESFLTFFFLLPLQDVVRPEEAASPHSEHPDSEFEGLGDYEESFVADWWQEPKTKGDVGEVEA